VAALPRLPFRRLMRPVAGWLTPPGCRDDGQTLSRLRSTVRSSSSPEFIAGRSGKMMHRAVHT
jgi:hypothetical protein